MDGLLDAKTSLEVCEAILHEKKKKAIQPEVEMTSADLNTVIFILQYMLTRLRVSIGNKPEYYNRLLGAKVSRNYFPSSIPLPICLLLLFSTGVAMPTTEFL